ncbi:Dihydropteroate synthase-like protein [Rhodocollybia butyracea]|uniref:2-amino-4-hydroxy-6-hydroxymethyldihydropteridine diphosphokinase n=1 Tax=Rhodocollybia butyracea TaxID=206335 RepID=A0A9P5UGH8_9AGAR|nr:Dihydropteroate synthase-like protein [Rhodocollybia butyracea]
MSDPDLIRVNDLLINVLLHSGSRWPPKGTKPTAQPILVSLAIPHDIKATAMSDDLSKSINYSTLASNLRTFLSPKSTSDEKPAFEFLEQILFRSFDMLLSPEPPSAPRLSGAHLKVVQLKPPLHCKTLVVECEAITGTDKAWNLTKFLHRIEDLECQTIIGVNPAERLEKQLVRINISIDTSNSSKHSLDYRALIRRLYERVESTSYLTLEALASFIAFEALQHLHSAGGFDWDPKVCVKAAKPCALVYADSSEVEISRRFEDYVPEETFNQPVSDEVHTAAIALGSNVGDSFQNIELAMRLLEAPLEVMKDSVFPENTFLSVVDTSFLYQSTPMYVVDQPPFLNCACLIETNISPANLLQLVKKIEEVVGRQPSFRNGPRAIDLDIVLYDHSIIDTRLLIERQTLDNLKGHLVVPHPRITEREFVLRPLFDMIPDYIHPSFHKTIGTLLKELLSVSTDPPMDRVIQFPRYPTHSSSILPGVDPVPSTLTHWKYNSTTPRRVPSNNKDRTRLMATLNATPDSFSDGSTHNTIPSALAYTHDAARARVDIMDIGGYSTRPGAAFVSTEEEINRVVPIVQAMRSEGDGEESQYIRDLPISVDTFRWEVVQKAVLAGANCINDVYAFTGPGNYPYPAFGEQKERTAEYMQKMKQTARKLAVPIILMHSRGDAGMNKDYSAYEYAQDGSVLEGVRIELGLKVDEIVKGKGGIRRWNIIVDPGIGFSKTVEGNLELLRQGTAVTADIIVGKGIASKRNPLASYPQLVGTSRKSFLGTILSNERGLSTQAKARAWATAAAVTCAVQQGALAVRVHDIHEMSDVVTIADALWR